MELQNVKPPSKSPKALQNTVSRHLRFTLGKDFVKVTQKDLFWAVSLAVREQLTDKMIETQKRYEQADAKRMYYLSMEFLMGRSLGNNLYNLGLFNSFEKAMRKMGVDLEEIRESEPDAALGNGGLGRLAACYLDSLATLGMPGYGYGINYEFGLFKQEIINGYQKEKPDSWLSRGTPWAIERPEEACIIPIYGKIEHSIDRNGHYNPMWLDWKVLIGVPYDLPIAGFGGKTVNFLRLYTAKSSAEFDMDIFNEGDYFKAVKQKIASETISKVLYPSDSFDAGRELRLIQEYFLVACALRDIMNRFQQTHDNFDSFPEKVAVQLNDTHPALAIPELMRLLIDEKNLSWEAAWDITNRTFAYTNHTLLLEALEKWPVYMIEHVIPRHLQIIYEINQRFISKFFLNIATDPDRLSRMSIIEETEPKQVRMANLAIAGCHSVNGVATLHTELLKTIVMADFYKIWPEKFKNITNGVTQRRWLMKANPDLSDLISESIGNTWINNIDQLKNIEPFIKDKNFRQNFLSIKQKNKERLADIILQTTRIKVNPESLFDIQTKRIHEYKRQLLNVLHIIHRYFCIIEDGASPKVPRTFIFSGKAAPGYWAAKQIIKLITSVGHVINNDAKVKNFIKVVFIPDYRVSLAEKIIPAADLSEQISTAGKEASGTGNMKFALNGALTIGTLDGANIEIMEEVGEDNIFIFGLKTADIQEMHRTGSYHPWDYYHQNPQIKRVMDSLINNTFNKQDPGLFKWIHEALLNQGDYYFNIADLAPYIKVQKKVDDCFEEPDTWAKKAILNVSRMGKFSSDRSIQEYADKIWHIQPCLK